mgnify:CR=1 FL=1
MHILLIISGGIAAYKSLDLGRALRREGHEVHYLLTAAAESFVTPLSCAALSENPVHRELLDVTQEAKIGHIQLARMADLVLVCPATADIMARMASGRADDLATTVLLATTAPILVAPAMNPVMWAHPGTQRNLSRLEEDGVRVIRPDDGLMACGETGTGRLADMEKIINAVNEATPQGPLSGKHVVVTAGPTHEPIDPVRYIANRSSGAQGFALAGSLARLGADVSLVAGPVHLESPAHVHRINVETALEMRDAVEGCLPADIAIFAAAVADWRPAEYHDHKMKKQVEDLNNLAMVENPDILAGVAKHESQRPALVIGFAAETDHVDEHAAQKLARKSCDWLVANDVSGREEIVMGGTRNKVTILRKDADPEIIDWADKQEIADQLAARIGEWAQQQ